MTTGMCWADWNEPDPVALTSLVEACDRSLGHEPLELTADDVSRLTQPGSSLRLAKGSATMGAVAVIRGDLAVVRVSMSAAERGHALEEAMSWVAPRLGGGAMWLPHGDGEAATAAEAAGFALQYVDLQMTCAVPFIGSPAPPPPGFAVVDLDTSDSSSMRAVHDLVCRTWSVEPHLAAFEERFASSAHDPSLWVLLTATTGVSAGRLVAAAWGSVQPSRGGPVGKVDHLDVDPDHRGKGLGPWTLSELVRRFRASDPRVHVARLGVHDDNASNAADLYRRMGWKVVSRHQKWTLPPPA